jgi:hypothetical protein
VITIPPERWVLELIVLTANSTGRRFTNCSGYFLYYPDTCGSIDPIKVEQRARTAPDVTRYLKTRQVHEPSQWETDQINW